MNVSIFQQHILELNVEINKCYGNVLVMNVHPNLFAVYEEFNGFCIAIAF